MEMGLIEQVQEDGIRWLAREVQGLAVAFGERLEITGASATAQDPKHRHQQREPLRIAHPTAVAAIGDRIEEADQVFLFSWIDCSRVGFGQWMGAIPLTKANGYSVALGRLLGGSAPGPMSRAELVHAEHSGPAPWSKIKS